MFFSIVTVYNGTIKGGGYHAKSGPSVIRDKEYEV